MVGCTSHSLRHSVLELLKKISYESVSRSLLTHKSNNKDSKEDPEDVTKNVHEYDGEESDCQSGFSLSPLGLSSAEKLPCLPDAEEDLRVHVDEPDEGQHRDGESGMPEQGERVPEDEGWVPPGLGGVHLVSTVVFSHGDLHELGDVEHK